MYKIALTLLLAGLMTACSKSSNTASNGQGNNNNNNNGNTTDTLSGWYVDSVSFHPTGTYASLLALQSDGKIIAVNPTQLARFNKDGTLDQSFTPITLTSGEIHALCVDNSDRIYVGGSFTQFNSSSYSYLVRLTRNGGVDNSLVSLMTGNNLISGMKPDIRCLALRSDGKLMVGGTFTYGYSIPGNSGPDLYSYSDIMRLNTDGSVDPTFLQIRDNYLSLSHYITHIDILPGDKMYVTGKTLLIPFLSSGDVIDVARLKADGSLDSSFNKTTGKLGYAPGSSGVGAPYVAKGLQDGSVLMGGDFIEVNGASHYGLLHISQAGLPDQVFPSVGVSIVTDICQFSANEIFVAEANPVPAYFGTPPAQFALFGADGKDTKTLKDVFSKGGDIYNIIRESDSTILIAGKMNVKFNASAPNQTVGMARIKKHS